MREMAKTRENDVFQTFFSSFSFVYQEKTVILHPLSRDGSIKFKPYQYFLN